MLPITLNISNFPVLLIGSAEQLAAREKQLFAAGASKVDSILINDLPEDLTTLSLAGYRILMICERTLVGADILADRARATGVLSWVEDQIALCDFYLPAIVKRGDLTIAIGTGGKSPTLARTLREKFERDFPEEWAQRLDDIAALRVDMRRNQATPQQISSATQQLIAENNWL